MSTPAPVVVRDLVKTFRSKSWSVDVLRAIAFGSDRTRLLVLEGAAFAAATGAAFLWRSGACGPR